MPLVVADAVQPGKWGPPAPNGGAACRATSPARKRAWRGRARYDDVVVAVLLRLMPVLAVCLAAGCTHVVTIETDPVGAMVTVDDKEVGPSPVRVEKTVFFGDQLRVSVEREGFEPATISVAASEWYLWPGLLAAVPLLGLPLSLPALVIPFAGPFIAAAVVVGWAVVTSPTLLSLALVRKYPDTVTVPLKRKRPPPGTDVLLPADLFGPDDLGANPIPDVGPGPDASPPPPAKPRPPDGANPLP